MLKVQIEKTIANESDKKCIEISFEINSGEIIGVFGDSAQGKSTLFNLIAGIKKAEKGNIVWNDTCWFNADKKIFLPIQKRKLAYLFQKNNLFPNMTVAQNIGYAHQHQMNEEVLKNLYTQFDLHEIKNKLPHQLSGGQQQKVAIMRTIVYDAELVLMDEPFVGLDFGLKIQLMKILKNWAKTKTKTVLMISHDLTDIEYLCDLVLPFKNHKAQELIEIKKFMEKIKLEIA